MLQATIEELRAVALGAEDASGYFPAMYARVTERIRQAAANGQFADEDAMLRFAHAFAGWYLHPRSGATVAPSCWQATWDVAGNNQLLIVQHLLLGMNAHINYDLAQVVATLADETGDLDALRPDFDAVNLVLADTMPEVLGDLGAVSRWVNLAAARGGSTAFHFSLRVARAQAWHSATQLHRLHGDQRRDHAAELDRLVSVLAYLITTPGWPARWFVSIGRRLELRDPLLVTRRLLGPLA